MTLELTSLKECSPSQYIIIPGYLGTQQVADFQENPFMLFSMPLQGHGERYITRLLECTVGCLRIEEYGDAVCDPVGDVRKGSQRYLCAHIAPSEQRDGSTVKVGIYDAWLDDPAFEPDTFPFWLDNDVLVIAISDYKDNYGEENPKPIEVFGDAIKEFLDDTPEGMHQDIVTRLNDIEKFERE